MDLSNDTVAAPKPTPENPDIVKLTPQLAEAAKRYDEVYEFSEGLAPCKKGGKWGYINHKGDAVIPYRYDAANAFINGLAIVITADKWEYINKK